MAGAAPAGVDRILRKGLEDEKRKRSFVQEVSALAGGAGDKAAASVGSLDRTRGFGLG